MNIFFLHNKNKGKQTKVRGFVLPLTLVVCVIILSVSAGISILLAKELYFSKLSKQSQVAYYAADNGLMCALMVDDRYVDSATGIGIFEYNNLVTAQSVLDSVNTERNYRGYSPLTLNSIKCATSAVFDNSASGYTSGPFTRINAAGNTEIGRSTTFSLRMDLGDGTFRCATILVNKTSSYRQIISRGFASCANNSQMPVERAIVNTSEGLHGSGASGSQTVFALTSGSSWKVPTNVTTIKVWSIGAGGGGAGATSVDSTSGGGAGAGGVAYMTFGVTAGDTLSYSLGTGGPGGRGAVNGTNGGDTSITVSGITLLGNGGIGGKYNSGADALGGAATGGSVDKQGGSGAGISGDLGGGGGGAIGLISGTTNGCTGGTGGASADISGLFAVLSILGYPTTSPGIGPGCGSTNVNAMNGSSATGFGNGGGGAGYRGGNGGNGVYGGGGGGAAGYSLDNMTGGLGGNGIVIISTQ